MDPITIALLAGGAYFLTRGKKTPDTFTPGSMPGTTAPGVAGLEIERRDINRILNTLKYDVIFPDGEKASFKQKLKRGDEQVKLRNGQYWLLIDVMQTIWKGKPDPTGAVMVVLMDSKKRPLAAKRVLMNEKKIIDVQ